MPVGGVSCLELCFGPSIGGYGVFGTIMVCRTHSICVCATNEQPSPTTRLNDSKKSRATEAGGKQSKTNSVLTPMSELTEPGIASNDLAEITLGPRTDDGYTLTIVRGYDDGTTDYVHNIVEYTLRGVEDVSIQDQYDSGGEVSYFDVDFVNGARIRLDGVVSEISNVGGDSE